MAGTNNSQMPLSFLNNFTHYVRIDFSCRHIDDENPHEFTQALQQQAQTLCKAIVSGGDQHTKVYSWPTLFTTCQADAVISRNAHQDRGAFLLGLQAHGSNEDIVQALQSWEDDVKTSAIFIDYIPVPSLTTHLVRKQDLGRLVVDRWVYPELQEHQITVFSSTGTSHEDHGITNVTTSQSMTSRAGSSVAVAAARRSPSPGKKLTPASAILNRLKWDEAFDSNDFIVVYEDRHVGLMESPIDAWTTESTEETFIPMHRVRAVKKRSTSMVVWHREERIDMINSGGGGR
jgi:uncharacterized protein (UPF0248 family)